MGIDIVEQIRELKHANEKAHGGIISSFSIVSNIVYCLIGFEHSEIMEKLGVNHLIFYDKNSFTYILQANKKLYEEGLKDKHLIFLSLNDEDYISFIKAFKDSERTYKKIYCFDIEVLKAVCLIPNDELKQNDYQIGLTVGGNGTLKALIDEVKDYLGFNDKRLYSYIKEVLEMEEKRIIKGKK
jgi:hypothetical protein